MAKKASEIKVEKKAEKISTGSFIFEKRNLIIMGIGLVCIALGFILMTGPDANTTPEGVYDSNYWNQGIFSWRRIRLAPFLVILGFCIEVYAILWKPKSKA